MVGRFWEDTLTVSMASTICEVYLRVFGRALLKEKLDAIAVLTLNFLNKILVQILIKIFFSREMWSHGSDSLVTDEENVVVFIVE